MCTSSFFDKNFYKERYALADSQDPKDHFAEQGWRLRYDPSPFFDTGFYLNTNPDVADAGINPLDHYLNFGWREHRSPSPEFDPLEFTHAHRACFDEVADPAARCLSQYGGYQWKAAVALDNMAAVQLRRKFLPYFDRAFYLENGPSVEKADSAFEYFLETSRYLDYDPSPDFDMQFYRSHIADNYGWLADPVYHYLLFGVQRKLAIRRSNDIGLLASAGRSIEDGDLPQVCVHLHCYYADLLDEFLPCFTNLPVGTGIVVTTVSPAISEQVTRKLLFLNSNYRVDVLTVENAGRDWAPFLVGCRSIWERSDLVLHLHTKKSPHVPWGDEWRRYLVRHTIGSSAVIKRVIDCFRADRSLGCFYPRNFAHIRRFTSQAKNNKNIDKLLSNGNMYVRNVELEDFPAGSMSWYRVDALKTACTPALSWSDFDEENGQYDGTLAHALERAIPIRIRSVGYRSKSYVCSSDLFI